MITDEKNNKIFAIEKKKGVEYYLHLSGEIRARKLGILVGDTLFIKRDRERHLFLKNNSYGFNDCFLRKILEPTNKIEIKEAKRKLKLTTTVKDILEKGDYLYFSKLGFERQIFLPLSQFGVTL